MSYELSFLQVLEDYDSEQSKYLTVFQRKTLLKSLQANLQPEYRRRIEIMLLADIGKTQTQICKILGCCQEMARYWSALAQAGLAHRWQERPIGRPKTVNEEYIQRLKELVTHSPREYGYSFTSWTAKWLSKHLAEEFEITVSDRHINRLLKKMGLSTKQKPTPNFNQVEGKGNNSISICDLQSNCESNFELSYNLFQIHT
ncbi:MAG: helix-turn-helix domain-containing protein [Rivularia sp. (in: cyanobacteria)]|jgi:transposase